MSKVDIGFVWKTNSPLALRTGHAGGTLDALVRERNGKPEIPGEAVKGAIREAAQRMLGWLGSPVDEPEKMGQPWLLGEGRLQRLFACEYRSSCGPAAQYKFNGAVGKTGKRFGRASTAIEYRSGVAKGESLRALEYWTRGIEFEVSIAGRNGHWGTGGEDDADLYFLMAAILSVEAVGGDQVTGSGCVAIENLKVEGAIQLDENALSNRWAVMTESDWTTLLANRKTEAP